VTLPFKPVTSGELVCGSCRGSGSDRDPTYGTEIGCHSCRSTGLDLDLIASRLNALGRGDIAKAPLKPPADWRDPRVAKTDAIDLWRIENHTRSLAAAVRAINTYDAEHNIRRPLRRPTP